MHPIYLVDPSNPAFDPFTWYNMIGAAGCVCWVVAYVMIVAKCFRDHTYGLPLVAICLNFAWELLASFVYPNPVALWHAFDRIWLIVDVVIVYQLLRWGRAEQAIAELRRYFPVVVLLTFVLGVWGQFSFVASYQDRLGLVSAFGVNLIMSILFVFFYFSRRDTGRGISRGGAVFKLLGTLGTSIECHWVVRLINPELKSLAFLTFLCVAIFMFDLLYVYFVFTDPKTAKRRSEPVASPA
jgi:hypothetical protein